jgi:argininosuccinate lyase
VVEGVPFREAYQDVSKQIQDGVYKSNKSKKHSHIGSIDNPGLEEIKAKFMNALN